MEMVYTELIEELKDGSLTKEQIQKIKNKFAKEQGLSRAPTDIEIGLHATSSDLKELKHLQTKPVRSISGVAPVALMTKPEKCPHGTCTMCPGGPGSEFGDVPQSYTGKEPASMRAIRANFDPYFQVFNRLEQYVVTGHVPDKVDLIIMGGTFPAMEKEYQEEFVKYCFRAMNDFSALFFSEGELDFDKFKEFFELPGPVGDRKRTEHIHAKLTELKEKSEKNLEEEQIENETVKIRCIGLTIETKPDWAFLEHANEMLDQGCTRVELGVQSVYNDALKAINRGHDVADNIKATQILKDLGFKINYHYMLGLPKVKKEDDLPGLKKIFEDPDWRPDMLKIYPCMVMKGTALYGQWQKGFFTPIKTQEAAEIISEFKRSCPRYVRIMRVQRDIPTYRTEAGVDKTNLRQYVQKMCDEKGINCECIRCREVGKKKIIGEPEIKIIEYSASGGTEFFISYETDNALLGFVRLRFPGQFLRKEITKDSALIRELHVYGNAVALGEQEEKRVQHKGIGKLLLKKAEEIAKEKAKDKVVVISGIGAREYYRKRGYEREGRYMVKGLQ